MKIAGHVAGLSRKKVVIDRGEDRPPIDVVLTALPLGTTQKLDKKIPGPVPKTIGPLMTGGKVVREADGSPVMLTDKESPKFKEADELANRRQSTLMLHMALAGDPSVEFDSVEDKCKSPQEFADKIFEELSDFGITIGDFGHLVSEVLRVSHLSSDRLDKAREAFLPVEVEKD